ncbi:MAG: hypothetical protein EBT78_12315, partial [Betaproteobacteria bacterium]|nr:hypothetical protein [Betaproteobacteria bacterium]
MSGPARGKNIQDRTVEFDPGSD